MLTKRHLAGGSFVALLRDSLAGGNACLESGRRPYGSAVKLAQPIT